MGFTIDIDTGGTFTDGFLNSGAEIGTVKVETTPHDLSVCFLNCIEEGAARFGLSIGELLSRTDIIRYSTTVGTNCLLQRSGPKLGLMVTEGFTGSLYYPSDEALLDARGLLDSVVPPNMRTGITEEIDSSGKVTQTLDVEGVRQAMESLLDAGARGIVIVFRHSARNPVHEQRARAIIDAEYPRHYLGSVPVLTAGAVTAHREDHVRLNTAVLNAYVHRDMVRYLYRADEMLRQRGYRRPLLVVHSSGGAARVAKTTALNTYNSGPVAGLLGCCKTAEAFYGIKDFISVDVGGTSVDIGAGTGGGVQPCREPVVEGVTIGLPMVMLATSAGGGGSIARVDPTSNTIKVGPESAGALPGPAAYDLGGVEPTVTDADLVLGYLDPDYFLGGRKRLSREKAVAAIRDFIAGPSGLSVEEAALRIVRSAEDDASCQVRQALEEKGLAPENLTLFAFGGGGGTRCCGYASRLGIQRIIVFSFNAVASAFGASTMDILHTYERPASIKLEALSKGRPAAERKAFKKTLNEMMAAASRDMKSEGFPPESLEFTLEFGVRGAEGVRWVQSPLITIVKPDEARRLSDLCSSRFASGPAGLTIELISLKAVCPVPHFSTAALPERGADPANAFKSFREVYWDQGYLKTPIYRHELLEPGNVVQGPAVIEAADTTYVIPPGWQYTADRFSNGMMEGEPR